ncbi:hypothetical protein Poli38472_009302 [Pythium oligandrum]|uniref:Peptidyl-prolyl cis-trans isomerase n=1 Tax=Pythium oligandrum TaxID=41045 RepID=A0A8K1CM36_PYTOL|nr:hypothetical protein Poli38472_009302 [Pythium oligandrum]|eukprot:TMW65135.1 hypothetical protein Poli38472_009302 [Pythium oligandrum]
MTMAKKTWTFALALAALCALLSVVMMPSGALAAGAPNARASHILVDTEAEADKLLEQLTAADDLHAKFAELAKEYSKCPSRRNGGDLGSFGRGAMVKEFDQVVFEKRMGVVHKVKTQFGWHLVLTTERSGVDETEILASEIDKDL